MEYVILVNESDQPIGLEEKLKAHELGLLHRAFSIFIFRHNGSEVLMQQRHLQKYHCGGLWTNTVCSHPREGEATIEAAHRRLQEEIGIQTSLQSVGQFIYRAELSNGLIEHELDHVFIGEYDGDISKFNRDEIAELKWMTIAELEHEFNSHIECYTPWLKQALNIAKKAL